MSYTSRSVAIVSLITFGLFALAGFGVVTGARLVLLIVVALATPSLILRNPVEPIATSLEGSWQLADDHRPSRRAS
jgi:hypothetical protein